jgi:hypothetical protein
LANRAAPCEAAGNGLCRFGRSGRLVLALSAAHRTVFAVLSALSVFILCFGVLFEGESTLLLGHNVGAGLLALVVLLGLLYEDRWTFDRAAARVENRFGTILLARRTAFPMADLEHIGVERFTRGRFAEGPARPREDAGSSGSALSDGLRRRFGERQRFVRLLAVERAGVVHVLDVAPAHRLMEFRNRGLRIAGFCRVGFEDATAGG